MKVDVAEQLRLLALVSELGTLGAAADVLGVTPAAVTQRLARAEAWWGESLVDRGRHGAVLTPAGAALARHGARIQREVDEAVDGFAAYRQGLVRRLRIGTFQAAALHLLPPAMTALRHRTPDADLSVVDTASSEALDRVADGTLDLAVFAAWDVPPAPRDDVAVLELLADPMVLACADDHRLARGRGPVDLARLAEEAWVVIRAGTSARAQFDRVTREAGFEARIRFDTESYDVAQALVATGYGVALVSRLAIRRAEGLRHRRLREPVPHRTVYVATRGERGTELAAEFVDLLVDVAGELGSGPR